MTREEILKKIEERKSAIKNGVDYIDFFNESIAKHENIIADLEQQLKQLKKKPPVILWKPEEKEEYFIVDYNDNRCVDIYNLRNDNVDISCCQIVNIYPTQRLAELQRDITLATQEYKRKIAEFNGDWEANWGNGEQANNTLEFSYSTDSIGCYTSIWYRDIKKEDMYFSDEVMENEQQLLELKTLYQKIIDLTEEYKLEEKKWRES